MAFPEFRYHDDRVQVVRNAWNIRTSTFGAHGRDFANARLGLLLGDGGLHGPDTGRGGGVESGEDARLVWGGRAVLLGLAG